MIRIPLPQIGETNLQSQRVQGASPPVGPNATPQQLSEAGGALQGFGQAAMEVASVLRLEHDTAATKEAYTRWAEHVTEVLENPETGYLNKVGRDAAGDNGAARAQAMDSIEQRMTAIEEGLKTPVSRGMFREQVQQRMADIRGRVYSHEANQRRVWNLGTTRAMAVQAERDAIQTALWGDVPPVITAGGRIAAQAQDAAEGRENPSGSVRMGGEPTAQSGPAYGPEDEADAQRQDPSRPTWQRHLATALENAAEESDLLGESPEMLEVRLEEVRSRVHEGIMVGLIDQERLPDARAFFEAHGDQLTPEARSKVDRVLTRATEDDRARSIGVEMFLDLSSEPPPSEPSRELPEAPQVGVTQWEDNPADMSLWQLERVQATRPGGLGSNVDPERAPASSMLGRAAARLRQQFQAGEINAREMDAAMSYVKEQHAIQMQAHAEEVRDTVLAAEQFLERNPAVTNVDSPSFPARMRDDLIRLGALDDVRHIAANRGRRVTDPEVYRTLWASYNAGTLATLSAVELHDQFRPRLSDSDWNEAQSMWASLTKQERPDPTTLFDVGDVIAEVAGEAGIIDGGFDANGIPKLDNTDPDQAAAWRRFRQMVERQARNVEIRNGKNLTRDEIRGIATEVASYATIDDALSMDERVGLVSGLDDALKYVGRLYVEGPKTGETVYLKDIPMPAYHRILDNYRIGLVMQQEGEGASRQLESAVSALRGAYDAGKVGWFDYRKGVAALFARFGVSGRTAPLEKIADYWAQMRDLPEYRQVEQTRRFDRSVPWSGGMRVGDPIDLDIRRFTEPPR